MPKKGRDRTRRLWQQSGGKSTRKILGGLASICSKKRRTYRRKKRPINRSGRGGGHYRKKAPRNIDSEDYLQKKGKRPSRLSGPHKAELPIQKRGVIGRREWTHWFKKNRVPPLKKGEGSNFEILPSRHTRGKGFSPTVEKTENALLRDKLRRKIPSFPEKKRSATFLFQDKRLQSGLKEKGERLRLEKERGGGPTDKRRCVILWLRKRTCRGGSGSGGQGGNRKVPLLPRDCRIEGIIMWVSREKTSQAKPAMPRSHPTGKGRRRERLISHYFGGAVSSKKAVSGRKKASD